MSSAACWAATACSSVDPGRRDHLAADAVDLDRLDDRVGDGLAVRAARDERGELAA